MDVHNSFVALHVVVARIDNHLARGTSPIGDEDSADL